jgi:hypothetical protein
VKEGDARLLKEGTNEDRDPIKHASVDAAMNCSVACVELSMMSRTSPIKPGKALIRRKCRKFHQMRAIKYQDRAEYRGNSDS